ncbi:Cd2+/Zn2+-exporting ATPase [Treponema bryantii]|uniref:P-type Zn(2+) transporter n=1 Tax=Treponema bryantii TaxID=163 RepID=A0A1H9HIA7_9SPIR|nr:heavy metal translocating P-type ATPase [Treponema bryantii]SEQ61952.1 Cd2+/Zn2+-exporting ATPase [Treponema bryantii]
MSDEHKHEHEHCECGHEHEHEHEHEHCECGHEHGHHHVHHEHDGCSCGCGHEHGHHHHDHEHGHEHGEEHELTVKQLIFAAVMFVLGLVIEHLPVENWFPDVAKIDLIHEAVCMVLYFIAFMITGKDIVIGAVSNLIHGELMDESFLMSVAAIGAILLGEYEEAVAIMILYQVGEKFEDYAVDKSRDSIEEIAKLRPDHATVKVGAETREVDPEEVETDSVIIVKPGDRIPIDGVVVDGDSFVDTSALTGESIPQHVSVGSEVLSGSINKQGVLEIRTTRHAGDSALSRILELVENATENKTKSEQFVTRFARVYTPIVVYSALALAIIPSVIIGFKSGNWAWQAIWSTWVYRALMFLVVSCPCALVISIPLSFCGGITAAARHGILIKGSVYLEALGRTKTAVFDKTGTLTKGNFVVTHIHATDSSITETELLALATHTEMFSTHPISASLKAAHHDKCCDNVKLENVEEIAGKGIKALVNGKEVLAGNTKLMEQFGIDYSECSEHQDGTVIHVASEGKYSGHIVISDEIKDDSQATVEGLHKIGVENVVMLTGDNERAAHTVAAKLGLKKAFGQLLSADKLAKVEELLADLSKGGKKRGTLIFAGDGINDAPVLARADAGIAMGNMGSDAAIEAADIIIMEDKPSKIVDGIKISRRTLRIVYENLYGALGIKGAILILSALGISNMWIAVFGDVGVTILAVLNSLRLLKTSKK